MARLTTNQLERIKTLYHDMPGAKQPPNVDGYAMWGDVDGTDEWRFCETLVLMMDQQIGAVLEKSIALRQAQRAYMADRGNNELGRKVGEAAEELDAAIAAVA